MFKNREASEDSLMKFGVIADDYTGANDTGVQFVKRGLKTVVLTQIRGLKNIADRAEVIVIDTESRADPEESAYKKVASAAEALKEMGVHMVYKKVDSTLRGNIGVELDAAMDVLDVSMAVVSPAFPKNGRIVVGGYLLLHQLPLERTEVAYDPKSPVRESHVPTLIQKHSRRRVGYIGLSKVLGGVEALRDEIATQQGRGSEIVVVDAVTQDDLKTIAKAIGALRLSCLICGSAGLAEELPEALGLTGREVGTVVVIAGSVSGVTMRQISRAVEVLGVEVIDINPYEVLGDEEKRRSEVSRVVMELKKVSDEGRDVVVRWARPQEFAIEVKKRGRELGLEDEDVNARALSALGEVAAATVDHIRVQGMALTGGDTAFSVYSALMTIWTEIDGEVLPGIPVVKLVGGKGDGMRVITKAGSFGDEEALVEAIRYLKKTYP